MIVVVTYEKLDKQGGMAGRLSTKLAVYERKGLPNHSYYRSHNLVSRAGLSRTSLGH